MIRYAKYFDGNRTISFIVNDKKMLKKYTKIWEKISSLIGKKIDKEPICGDNDKYIMAKIKSYRDKTNSNFQSKKNNKRKYITFVIDNARFCY